MDVVKVSERSPYQRGKRLFGASMLFGITIIWGMPIAATILGIEFGDITWIVFPLLVIWVIYFGVSSLLLACPKCGRSLFMRGYLLSVPWPAKTCGKCGTDLTINR
ncbi:hypothetical protein [Croceicoccus sp. Ery15]|uniref:hypothetical protein n=1 Tax=Croceicoccus sp. Ery15 TaxID=1703338 RepID=UPI001E51C674|nr:hypothetical protein [Croceicoccus sp. Ery15]